MISLTIKYLADITFGHTKFLGKLCTVEIVCFP